MDRHFVIQKQYLDDMTGLLIKHLLEQYAGQFLDTWEINDAVPENKTFKSERGYTMKVIPVGYLQYVAEALKNFKGPEATMIPLEIPVSLEPFLQRKYIRRAKGEQLIKEGYADADHYFIKDVDTLKNFNSAILKGNIEYYINPDANYSVSEKVNIVSEYRCLFCDDELVDISNYLGDKLVFPNRDTIAQMIEAYRKEEHPRGFTLDIAVTAEGNTTPLEIHPFVSCGFYSMSEDNRIIDMLDYGFEWYLAHN